MNVIEDLRKFLVEKKFVDSSESVDASTSILEILDSLSIYKLIAFIENSYQIAVDEDDLNPENFETLMAIRNYVSRKVS